MLTTPVNIQSSGEHVTEGCIAMCVGDVPKMVHFVTKIACLIAKIYDFKEMFSRRRSSQMIACYVADDFNK